MSNSLKLKMNNSLGRILLLHAKPYKGCMVYIRQIDEDLFLYDVVFNGQIFPFHLEVTHKIGEKLSESTIRGAVGMVLAGAHATIDTLTKSADVREQAIGKTVIDAGEAAWYIPKKKGEKN